MHEIILIDVHFYLGFPGGSGVKSPPAMQETQVQLLGGEDPLEKERAIHSTILAWEIPWTEEPGQVQLAGWQRVGHDLVTEHACIFLLVNENKCGTP